MTYKKSERTRNKIIDTFYHLAAQDSTKLPCAAEICDVLDIHRSSFYNHFSGIDELVEAAFYKICDEIDKKTLPSRVVIELYGYDEVQFRAAFCDILDFLLERKEDMLSMMNPNVPFSFHSIIDEHIELLLDTLGKENIKYAVPYISEGIINACYAWLKDPGRISSSEFSSVLGNMVLGSVKYL